MIQRSPGECKRTNLVSLRSSQRDHLATRQNECGSRRLSVPCRYEVRFVCCHALRPKIRLPASPALLLTLGIVSALSKQPNRPKFLPITRLAIRLPITIANLARIHRRSTPRTSKTCSMPSSSEGVDAFREIDPSTLSTIVVGALFGTTTAASTGSELGRRRRSTNGVDRR